MKIGVLTSSRADYGIYLPLLNQLMKDPFFNLEVIAFGTHLSSKHGRTITEIERTFNGPIISLDTPVEGEDAHSIAFSYGKTVGVFAEFWLKNQYDLVLCLGDRYEMSAAVQASIPYNIRLGHFHGGETTLGAFDNIYRHQISLASKYHLTATEEFAERVKELLDSGHEKVFAIGSLSLSDLHELPLISKQDLNERYNLPDKPYILCTFHPETEDPSQNGVLAKEMSSALIQIPETHHIVISMPNADTNANIYREELIQLKNEYPLKYTLIESFGKTNYFSAMQHTEFLLGNSSSGIIEAASFGKMVINVGRRQEGRLQSGNVLNVPFKSENIVKAVKELIEHPGNFSGQNKYIRKNTLEEVSGILRSIGNGEL